MRGRLVGLRRRGAPASPWESIVGSGLPERRGGGPTVLCATSVGGHSVARAIDGLVGTALWLRDAEPVFLLCDAVLPACELCTYVEFPNTEEFVDEGPNRGFVGRASRRAPLGTPPSQSLCIATANSFRSSRLRPRARRWLRSPRLTASHSFKTACALASRHEPRRSASSARPT